MPQFFKLTKQTIKNLNTSISPRTKHIEDCPTGRLRFKDSRSPGRWHKSNEPTVRELTQEYIPLGDLRSTSLKTIEASQKVDAKGDKRNVDGRQASETGTADLGGGIVRCIRIETEEVIQQQ